jgi:putative membrane protein
LLVACHGGGSFVIVTSLAGLPAFAAYFVAAVTLCALYLIAYTYVTPNDEFRLMFEEHNASTALALGMSLMGFSLPLASAIYHSANIIDCVIWGLVALIAQLIAYFLARSIHPDLGAALRNNSMAAALWLGFVSLTIGVLSAVCMSW